LEGAARARKLSTPLPVLLHADREAPWSVIRETLAALHEAGLGTHRVQWAVRSPDAQDACVDGRVAPASPAKQPFVLRIVPDRRETWTAVRILSPAGIHSFGPQSKQFASEKFLLRANRTWDALERALTDLASEYDAAHVEIVDEYADAWFAYVVKAVDVLFAAGFAEVHLPQEGLVMARPAGD